MTRSRSRWLGASLLASAGVGLLEIASMLNPAVALADDTALIMGFAGNSDPPQSYVNEVMSLFINPSTQQFPGQPTFPGYSPLVQSTPEGLDYQQVIPQGTAELDAGISQQLLNGNVVVFGYSESTSIATQEMVNLGNLPAELRPDPADLKFILVEDLNNPNGGFLERFPSLATESFPATPADTPYDTAIYTIEYSGSSDFPQYPLNLLADANALAGYIDLHPFLLPDWPTGFTPSELAGAVLEPTSLGYDGNTDYYLIPTQNLPLLDGLRAIPIVGNPTADLMQPDMRVIIDLGYDRAGGADLTTPADWQMPDINWTTVTAELATGAQQGWTAAMVDMGLLPTQDLPDAYPYLPDVSGLASGSAATSAAATAASALAGDVGGATSINALSADVSTSLTTELNALFGSGAATELTSMLSSDFLPSLTALLGNPLDLLSF
jgi:diacyltrehalose acyltransferase